MKPNTTIQRFDSVKELFFLNRKSANRNICPYCDRPVDEVDTWWAGNPNQEDSRPMHEACAKSYLFFDE